MFRFLLVLAFIAVLPGPADARDGANAPPAIRLPAGFALETIAHIDGPRELAVAANGDLVVGTNGHTVMIVPDAQGAAGAPQVFVRVADRPVAGVALAGDTLFIGGQFGVYTVPLHAGERHASAPPRKIAVVRPSKIARDHVTTTVAVANGRLYAAVGSSCNNCSPELDATRATIQEMRLDGTEQTAKAERIRNAIALTIDPHSGDLWAGVAGQDELEHGHPYEIVDDVSAHPGRVDYGWPQCYEDRLPVDASANCTQAAVPRIALPAYETPVGAAFYPLLGAGRYAFPAHYRGGLFVALHGSWHRPLVPPRVVFVPMLGDQPQTPVNWADPGAQWSEFAGGFQQADGTRIGRPTGIAVGTDGSLFVADDAAGAIYRIRPRLTLGTQRFSRHARSGSG